MLKYEIDQTFENLSITEFFEKFHLSKKMIYLLKTNKDVYINQENKNFEYILNSGDILEIDETKYELNNLEIWKQNLEIVYEDSDVLIVNKPNNILVHPDGVTNKTLSNIVSFYYQKNHLERSVRHIHRLDYQTSGMVIFAKSFLVNSFLSWQLENNLIEKKYLALVEKFGYKSLEINSRIAMDRHVSNKFRVSDKGKEALSVVKYLKDINNYKLLEVKILTGRTHQIRVHLASIGSAIIGDDIYGSKIDSDMFLHHYKVSFIHPRDFERKEYVCKKEFKL